MSQYGVVFPEFWTGATGRAIRQLGGKDAQLLSLYLISSQHANMVGLYHLPLPYVLHETGLTRPGIVKAFSSLAASAVSFADYDAGSEHVWVREMARFRLGLAQPDAKLGAGDKRITAANRIYETLSMNAFLGPFFDRYHKALHLRRRRDGPPLVALWRGLEGASEGLRSQ